jgi:Na+-transporting NADH:ubiquinone oxidoreductase subunit NqrC
MLKYLASMSPCRKVKGIDYSNDPHKVDGMSGATLTAGKGVNNMLVGLLNLLSRII